MSGKPPAVQFWPTRSGSDRRRHRRHRDAFYVRLMRKGAASSERCELLDISEGGMGVLAPEGLDLPHDTIVTVEFPLGRSSSRLQTHCIVRALPDGEPNVVHLEFYDDSALFRQTVLACIVSWNARPVRDRRDRS